jgi:uncharacterized protein (TIGR04255 family)
MSGHYENPPLIELIAELQWSPPTAQFLSQVMPGVPIQLPVEMAVAAEQFYNAFAIKVDELGFRNSERLVPSGASFPGQVAIRYRKSAGAPPLIQVGVGVFTMNGLPPTYTHWGEFSPMLKDGLAALLDARSAEMGDDPFASLSLRYINAFGAEYWAESSPEAFITDVLGFNFEIPRALTDRRKAAAPISPSLQLRIPMNDGSTVALVVAEGQAGETPAVIVDTTVLSADVPGDLDSLVSRFESAHSVVSELFESMTADVADIMRPIATS